MNVIDSLMASAQRPTILIVEDEFLVREIAVVEFQDAGYDVLEAGDGNQALGLLDQHATIDLLFTDIRLPGQIDGWEIAARARELRPSLPVIYATGFSADTLQLVPGGRFFKKPYRPTDIIAAAKEFGVG